MRRTGTANGLIDWSCLVSIGILRRLLGREYERTLTFRVYSEVISSEHDKAKHNEKARVALERYTG